MTVAMSSRPSWISALVSTSHGASSKALGEAALEQSVFPFASTTKRNSEQIPSVRRIPVHEQTATVILAGIACLYAAVHSRRTRSHDSVLRYARITQATRAAGSWFGRLRSRSWAEAGAAGREESNHSAPMDCVRHRTDGDAHSAIKRLLHPPDSERVKLLIIRNLAGGADKGGQRICLCLRIRIFLASMPSRWMSTGL